MPSDGLCGSCRQVAVGNYITNHKNVTPYELRQQFSIPSHISDETLLYLIRIN